MPKETCRFCGGHGYVMSSKGRSSAECPFCKGEKQVEKKPLEKNCIKCGKYFRGRGNFCPQC